jgi:co-chaperonin GroES (HSP10)
MSQVVVLAAGLLAIAQSQASDVTDRSTRQGFLSQFMPYGSDSSQSTISDHGNFLLPSFNRGIFTTVDNKAVLHSTAQVQDSMAYTPARGEASISNKDFDPPKIANREEMQVAKKLFANITNIAHQSVVWILCAVGIGALSLVTMLVGRLRTRLQPATILDMGMGPDMGLHDPDMGMMMSTKSALGDNVMEMKSLDSDVEGNSGRVGWERPSPQGERPLTEMSAITNEETFTRQQALYDLVYVERIKPPEQSAGGLFLIAAEDPPMHLAKVVSVGAGGQGESGKVVENGGIQPGDLVYCKHPWGIGPKDEEFGEDGEERRFSFLRYTDIAAVVRK